MSRTGLIVGAAFALLANGLPHRSQGYAGSTPVGQGSALEIVDCKKLQAAVNAAKSQVGISLFDECPLKISAPQGSYVLEVITGGGKLETGSGMTLSVRKGNGVHPVKLTTLDQPVTLLWRPDGNAFLLDDGKGSGQTSILRVFMLRDGAWQESNRFHHAAERAYFRAFDCWKGAYTNVSGRHWTKNGKIVAIVQEGVHSAGCLLPRETEAFEVIGDPWTGVINRARSIPWKSAH